MFKQSITVFPKLERIYMAGVRRYVTPEGKRYPSVTSITGLYGKETLDRWRKRVGEEEAARVSRVAGQRGTAVHEMCEAYVQNLPMPGGMMPDVIPVFNKIKLILDKSLGEVFGVESRMFSDWLRVAGTADLIAMFDGKLAIIDFKSSAKPKKAEWIENYFMQCAAYAVMYEERTGIQIPRLVIIVGVIGSEPQVFVRSRNRYLKEFMNLRTEFETLYGY
jgi:genome maintenance exonuclease 1